MTSKEKKQPTIQSLKVGLNILEILGREKVPLKFMDIQNISKMTKSNLYKYLATLCEIGLVYRNPNTNTYSLGYKLVELGNVALGNTPIVEVSIPYLKEINEKTNLTALLAIPSEKGPLITYISSADYGINIGTQIGANLPLSSSTGVIFSTFENEESMKEWEKEELSKMTEEELTQFKEEQLQAKKIKFASKIEPLIQHVSSFSIPIFNFNRQLMGAITVVGYTELIPDTLESPISKTVIDIALQISKYYGYSQ